MKRYLLLALFLAVIQYSQGQSSKKSYTNPICTEDPLPTEANYSSFTTVMQIRGNRVRLSTA